MLRRLALVCSVCCAASSVAMAQEIHVVEEHYRCLIQNVDTYSNAAEDGIVIIILSDCPDTEVTAEDLQQLALNVDVNPQRGSAVPFISLRTDELICIGRKRERFLAVSAQSGTINITRALRDYC